MAPTVKIPNTGLTRSNSALVLKRAVCQVAEHSATWEELSAELEAQNRFERLIVNLSSTFLNEPPDRFDDVINSSLEALAALLGYDRSTLAEFRADDDSVVVTHSYAVPSTMPFPLGALDDDRFPWDFERIRRGGTVFMRHPSELPLEAEKESATTRLSGSSRT